MSKDEKKISYYCADCGTTGATIGDRNRPLCEPCWGADVDRNEDEMDGITRSGSEKE